MTDQTTKRSLRCAVYTRVSTDQGLEQDFNSLDAQREASEAYIKSQAHEGWRLLRDHYDDGGYSGGSMDRPALHLRLRLTPRFFRSWRISRVMISMGCAANGAPIWAASRPPISPVGC